MNKHIARLVYLLLVVLVFNITCVDPVNLDLPPPRSRLVVEGFISTDPPPYTVKVSKGFSIDAIDPTGEPVENVTITLFDNEGNSELLEETSPGIYNTTGIITGEIGKAYHITIETEGGEMFESEPDLITPTGQIDDIRFQYNQRVIKTNFGETPADVFEVFVDGNAGPREQAFTRWNVIGTYEIETSPHLRVRTIRTFSPIPIPPACSGYIIVGCVGATKVVYDRPCECCSCWVTSIEETPQLSDNAFIANGEYRNVKVTEVPINPITFFNKYRLEVEQMSMTRTAYQFFNQVRSQKLDSDNFFQPTFGEIKGNIESVNTDNPITGIFWATQISKNEQFITRDDIPYPITPIEIIPQDCRDAFPLSTIIKPDGWD